MTPIAKLPVDWVGESSQFPLPTAAAGPSPPPAEQGFVATRSVAPHDPSDEAAAGWARAADVGVTIGRASQAAGVATAGFFRRFGKKVAASF
jgi:hypothetical protein